MAVQQRHFMYVEATPVVLAADAYDANDSLHTADMTFSNVVYRIGDSGILRRVFIFDKDAEGANNELWLFAEALANTTHTADAAWTVTDADYRTLVAIVPLTTHYASAANKVTDSGVLDIPFTTTTTTSLFGVLVTRGTPTYTAVDDVVVRLVFERV